VLVGHNNDLSPRYRDELVAIERRVPGDPAILTIGNGIWISVGWNAAGLSLTGNELSPNDERVGIPRELQVREMLRDTSLDAMVGTALRHDRASSYNNVLASSDGGVVNVEGSATSAEMTEPDERGHLVHTNHYVCDAMLPYEGDPAYARRSAVRYARAEELLAAQADGTMTEERMREILSDHEHAPDSLCRHAQDGVAGSVTCFWCVADVTGPEALVLERRHRRLGEPDPVAGVEDAHRHLGCGDPVARLQLGRVAGLRGRLVRKGLRHRRPPPGDAEHDQDREHGEGQQCLDVGVHRAQASAISWTRAWSTSRCWRAARKARCSPSSR